MKKLICLLAFLPLLADADTRYRTLNPASVIEDSVCIPAIDGEGYVGIEDSVSGLIIEVIGADGQQVALYDAGTEIEDVASPGTGAYTAPSANNVRASPDGGGADCTEMQLADAVYAGQDWVTIRVTDGQTTIMDFERWVFLNAMTSTMAGLRAGPVNIDTVTGQQEFILAAGASNDDAYPPGSGVIVKDASSAEECEAEVSAYTGSSTTIELTSACPFTVANNDKIWIFRGPSGPGLKTLDTVADSNATAISTVDGLIGTPADTDIATDIANHVTTIGTPADTDIATDIANHVTTLGTPADTDIATDIANHVTTLGTPADTDIATDIANHVTTIGTPADTDIATDIANAVTIIGTPADTDIATDIANVATTLGTPVDTDLATDLANLDAAYRIQTGTCDSGGTTTCVDAALDEGDDDYWRQAILFTSGTIAGQSRCIHTFDEGTDTLTFRPAVTQAVSTNTYVLINNPVCALILPP